MSLLKQQIYKFNCTFKFVIFYNMLANMGKMKVAAIIASSVGILTGLGGAGYFYKRYKENEEDRKYKLRMFTMVD